MAATAVEAWDERWATPEGRADWLMPHPAVAALVPVLKARGAQHVLDLGCGVGRHALLFAEHGFAVEAIDGAAAGLDVACREAAARGLRLSLRQADADALPFADESFDYVLSWNVIFHGTMGDVGRRLAEIWRILKPGGLYQGTMLSKRDAQFGRGRPVAPDTFIRGSDAKGPCCTDQPVDAVIPCPRGLMRCGRSSGVPAPAYGSGRRQQLPLRPLDACWFASAAHDR